MISGRIRTWKGGKISFADVKRTGEFLKSLYKRLRVYMKIFLITTRSCGTGQMLNNISKEPLEKYTLGESGIYSNCGVTEYRSERMKRATILSENVILRGKQ